MRAEPVLASWASAEARFAHNGALNNLLRRLAREHSRALGWIYLGALAWTGVYVCRESFYRESTGHFASMHGEWLAMARIVRLDWLPPRWWPYWGGGAPIQFAYAPLVPFSIAALSAIFHITPAMALHALTGFIYCFGPLAVYLAAWRLSDAPGPSFLIALVYALAAPAEFVDPRAAHGLAWLITMRRSYRLFEWDDLPHLTAFALFPLAVWLLARALKSRGRWAYVPAGAAMAAMMLASMFGFVLSALAVLTVPAAMENRLRTPQLARAALVAAAAYCVVCPWAPPSLLRVVGADARMDGEADWSARGFLAFGILLLAWLAAWLAARRFVKAERNWPIRWAILYACPAILIPVLDRYASLHFLPQPGRYAIEMELGMTLALACAAIPMVRRIPGRGRARALLAIPLVAFAGMQLVSERRFIKRIERPVDVTGSIEYRAAKWLETNLPNRRVMLPGSMAAWLNAFGNSPELGGQSYSTAPNWMQQVAQFTIYSGDGLGDRDTEYSILWLKAFGVAAVGVSGPSSPEYWKPFAHPNKFEGALPVLWREDDTTIYGVPLASASLAHAMRAESVVRHKPVSGADVEELRRYVAALDDPASAAFLEWRGPNRAAIRARLRADQSIATQITYDPGWRATVNGAPREAYRDGIGFLVVRANCAGECEVDLNYDGGLEARLCRAASLGALLVAGGFVMGVFRRRGRG
jgi:hypothetical protein